MELCEHTCLNDPHTQAAYGGSKLSCCNQCPSCKRPIRYGELNAHLRTCHASSNLRLKIMISSLTWKLADVLQSASFEIVIAEALFWPYRVDVLLAEEWLGFEADGAYHFTPERKRYDKERDRKLVERFDLPIARLTGYEVERLYESLSQ